jgi:hypothetical protein
LEGGSVSTPAPAPAAANPVSEASPDAEAQPTQVAAPDDPEIEIDDGVKLKRSELRDVYKRRKELDRGAFDKFQEAAKLRKEAAEAKEQAQQIVAGMSKDYKAALRAAGHDPIKVAEQILAEALEEYQLTPEQKEARDAKAKLAEYEQREQEQKQAHEEAQRAAAVAQWEQRFDAGFTQAIQTSGLPKTAKVVSRMAEKVELYWGQGVQVPLDEIAAEVKQDLIQERRELLQSAKDEQLAELFDESELEKARKLILRKAQASAPKPIPQHSSAPKKVSSGKGLTRAELEARISKRLGA